MRRLFLSLAGGVLILASGALMSSPATTADGALVGPNGMTLYTFDRDVAGSGKSACTGACATLWPPLLASDTEQGSGDYAVIVRDDGKKQWAYKGKPLYYFGRDSKSGDKTGDGYNQAWKMARP